MRKPDKRKSYEIDAATMKQAQKVLGTKTEAETIPNSANTDSVG